MDRLKISKEFPHQPVPSKVSRQVAEGIDKLREHNIDSENILDIYIESQKYLSGKTWVTNPMQYIRSCLQNDKDNLTLRFREIEKTYNLVVKDWLKIPPEEFVEQYESYVLSRQNDSGWENGFLCENFFGRCFQDEKILVVDPSPSFLRACKRYAKDITFAFTNDSYYIAYTSNSKSRTLNIKKIDVLTRKYSTVLFFASYSSQSDLIFNLNYVRNVLVAEEGTNIYIVLAAKHLEKRKTKPELWNYINEYYCIQRIMLIDPKSVHNTPKKRAIVVLQNAPPRKPSEILVQKTRLLNKTTFASLEFHRVPYSSFCDRDRTLSEMYDTDYIDYAQPNRRNKPIEYKFSREISIWISFAINESGSVRPTYGIYDYPTQNQIRKNTLLRGKSLKNRISGKWYASKTEAIDSAELLFFDNEDAAKKMRLATNKEYDGRLVSLKTFLFMHWIEMHSQNGFDPDLCKDVFFRPISADAPLCAMMVEDTDSSKIDSIVSEYAAENSYSETKTTKLLRQLEILFDYAVIDNLCKRNAVRHLINSNNSKKNDIANMRNALVNNSFTEYDEQKLVAFLIEDEKNPEMALLQLVRYYTGLPINVLRALKCKDYLYNPKLDLGQLAVTKEMVGRSDDIRPIIPENRRRYIPLPKVMNEKLRQQLSKRPYRENSPLFINGKGKNKVFSTKQVYTYLNDILENVLDLPEFVIPIVLDDKTIIECDLNQYYGDILRSNFCYKAKKVALLDHEEISFFVGRSQTSTESMYYCDYNNIYLQLIMRVKLDRWAIFPTERNVVSKTNALILSAERECMIVSSASDHRTELCIELDIDNDAGETIDLHFFTKYGGKIQISFEEDQLCHTL